VYQIRPGANVAGVRFVDRTIELLDSGGTPRLRMSPPYIMGSDGVISRADVSLTGCRFDTNPAIPWGRAVTPPSASSCAAHISWNGAQVSYPALLDPLWSGTGSMSVARYN